MKAITLRDIPPKVQKVIRDRARRRRISEDRAVIELLEEQVPVPQRGEDGLYHDLDDLFGTWSDEEADEFDRILREMRQIDRDMWK
jgi:transcriptional regulator of met regulon